jgi:1-aminocyclopropane-1-carboxylate deaminase
MFPELNSPVEQLQHPLLDSLWVKRDDQIDPYISGNKWRKLKYILADAIHEEKSHLVTFGGAYSNHLVATASAASRAGLRATAFVRGEPVNNEMLLLCRLFGMELKFTSRDVYKNKKLLFEQHFSQDEQAFFIDEGGAGRAAVKGCAELIGELPEDVDHIFCAAGTGTTAAGLLEGIRERGLRTKLHVIPVLKGDFIRDEISKYVDLPDQLIVHGDYHFGGYAKTTPELLTFMKQFIARHGMLIDPLYTAKLFYAIDDLARKQVIDKGEKIVAIHTGGLLGIWGMKDKLFI